MRGIRKRQHNRFAMSSNIKFAEYVRVQRPVRKLTNQLLQSLKSKKRYLRCERLFQRNWCLFLQLIMALAVLLQRRRKVMLIDIILSAIMILIMSGYLFSLTAIKSKEIAETEYGKMWVWLLVYALFILMKLFNQILMLLLSHCRKTLAIIQFTLCNCFDFIWLIHGTILANDYVEMNENSTRILGYNLSIIIMGYMRLLYAVLILIYLVLLGLYLKRNSQSDIEQGQTQKYDQQNETSKRMDTNRFETRTLETEGNLIVSTKKEQQQSVINSKALYKDSQLSSTQQNAAGIAQSTLFGMTATQNDHMNSVMRLKEKSESLQIPEHRANTLKISVGPLNSSVIHHDIETNKENNKNLEIPQKNPNHKMIKRASFVETQKPNTKLQYLNIHDVSFSGASRRSYVYDKSRKSIRSTSSSKRGRITTFRQQSLQPQRPENMSVDLNEVELSDVHIENQVTTQNQNEDLHKKKTMDTITSSKRKKIRGDVQLNVINNIF